MRALGVSTPTVFPGALSRPLPLFIAWQLLLLLLLLVGWGQWRQVHVDRQVKHSLPHLSGACIPAARPGSSCKQHSTSLLQCSLPSCSHQHTGWALGDAALTRAGPILMGVMESEYTVQYVLMAGQANLMLVRGTAWGTV